MGRDQRQTSYVAHFQSSGCSVAVPSHKEQCWLFFLVALNCFRRFLQTGPASLRKHQPRYWPQRRSRPEKVLISPQNETHALRLPPPVPGSGKMPRNRAKGERGDRRSGGREEKTTARKKCAPQGGEISLHDAAEEAATQLSPLEERVGVGGVQGWYRVSNQLQMWIFLFPARSLAFCPSLFHLGLSLPFSFSLSFHGSWPGRRCCFLLLQRLCFDVGTWRESH